MPDCCNCGQICVTTTNVCGAPAASGTIDVLLENTGIVGTDCVFSGKVTGIAINNHGSGYTSIPTVTVDPPPSGTTAVLTATIAGGQVSTLAISDPGSGYNTLHPGVTITGGGGTGAAATATVASICCVPITKPGNYLVTSTGPTGVITRQVIAATCSTNNTTITTPGFDFPVDVGAALCGPAGACSPTSAHPVTVVVTQTTGGAFTTTLNFTSAATQRIYVPSASSHYSVSWSSSGFATQTDTTANAGGGLTNPQCFGVTWKNVFGFSSATGLARTSATDFCYPQLNCTSPRPATIFATLDGTVAVWGAASAGTMVTLSAITNASPWWLTGESPTDFQWAVCLPGKGPLTVYVSYTDGSSCTVVNLNAEVTPSFAAGVCGAQGSAPGFATGASTGTVCPISGSITLTGGGSTATMTISQ